MPEGPESGDRGRGASGSAARLLPRLAAASVMLLGFAATALFAYDHRQTDMGVAGVALPDGRVASIDSSGATGPRSLVVVGHSSGKVRPLPPVLARSTSADAARAPNGLAVSPEGWVTILLGRLGHDREGGQITQVSPTGELLMTLPLLHRQNSALIGVTDVGLAVFRQRTIVSLLNADGEATRLLDVRHLGVRGDLSNLAGVALAADGRLAVLVGDGRDGRGYRLFQRLAGGAADRVVRISPTDLFGAPVASGGAHVQPAVAFSGPDIVIAGDAGLVRLRDGRVRDRVTVVPADRARMRAALSALVALPGDRWAVGTGHLSVLDASGRLHHPGYGPCPAEPHIRARCPAVLAGHRLPRPQTVFPDVAGVGVGAALVALAWAGRTGRARHARLRLAATLAGAAWVSAWLVVSMAWGDLHGSAPLLLLGAATLAILAPAFPATERRQPEADAATDRSSYQPWVTDRITGRTAAARGARHLEVIPLPSRS